MKISPWAVVTLGLTLAACSDGDANEKANATIDRDSGAEAEGDARVETDLSLVGNAAMDTLSGPELQALCEEGERRADPCMEQGIRATNTAEACEEMVAACESTGQDSTCAGVELGSSETCLATVDEYLACMDAWTASLACSNARYQALPPEHCQSVIDACEILADAFFIRGDPWPCTPEESDYVPPAIGDGIYGADGCLPEPARFVVLGDSIASCTGPTSTATCAPYLIVDALRAGGSAGLEVEMHAWPGSKTADLRPQAEEVAPGPGHVFVWIFAVGNDLLNGNFDTTYHLANYDAAFAYFADVSAFPDGATFFLNTQYELWDGCTAPGTKSGYTPELIELIVALNRAVFIDVAEARADTLAVDNYADFLGHAQNANIAGCPYCSADNTRWLDDGLHPNDAGHAHMATKWIYALEGKVGAACSAPTAP